jgi:hypothetical protein
VEVRSIRIDFRVLTQGGRAPWVLTKPARRQERKSYFHMPDYHFLGHSCRFPNQPAPVTYGQKKESSGDSKVERLAIFVLSRLESLFVVHAKG